MFVYYTSLSYDELSPARHGDVLTLCLTQYVQWVVHQLTVSGGWTDVSAGEQMQEWQKNRLIERFIYFQNY